MGDADASLNGSPFQNTNIMDRNSMPSPQAEMARQKSQEIMEALKKHDGSAEKLMAESHPNSSSSGGFRNWIKRRLGPGSGEPSSNGASTKPEGSHKTRKPEPEHGGIEGLKGTSNGIGVEDSSAGVNLGDPAPPGDVLARDGGKGDGVIR